MLCKKCGVKTIVSDKSINTENSETYRLRICPKCGESIYTVEFPVEMDRRFKRDWADHHNPYVQSIPRVYYSRDGLKKLRNKIYKNKHNKE